MEAGKGLLYKIPRLKYEMIGKMRCEYEERIVKKMAPIT